MSGLALVKSDPLAKLAATANAAHREAVRNVLAAGQALLKAEKLLPKGMTFDQWVGENCDFSPRTARDYKRVARHWLSLPEAERQRAAAASIRQVVTATKRPSRWSCCTGDVEWYTPPPIIEHARDVLGTIDLDPASCPAANAVVGARRFFTVQQDGLKQSWRGKVWMNPPFARLVITSFCEKLVEHVRDRSVTEAIVLVNSDTATRWFRVLSLVATAICFTTGRVKFWKPSRGKDARTLGTCPLGTAIVYFGRHRQKFHRAFKGLGPILYYPSAREASQLTRKTRGIA